MKIFFVLFLIVTFQIPAGAVSDRLKVNGPPQPACLNNMAWPFSLKGQSPPPSDLDNLVGIMPKNHKVFIAENTSPEDLKQNGEIVMSESLLMRLLQNSDETLSLYIVMEGAANTRELSEKIAKKFVVDFTHVKYILKRFQIAHIIGKRAYIEAFLSSEFASKNIYWVGQEGAQEVVKKLAVVR